MPHDYRYDPFNDTSEAIAITGETHVIPSNSPYTIRLNEVPMKDTPSSISLTIGGVAANEVSAPPAAGEFWPDYSTKADNDDSWNTGTIIFNAADAGKTVIVSYVGTGTLIDLEKTRALHGSDIFTASGSWVCPAGITRINVLIIGGGGGGNGFNGPSSITGSKGGDSLFSTLLTAGGGLGGKDAIVSAPTVTNDASIPTLTANFITGSGGAKGTNVSTSGKNATGYGNGGGGAYRGIDPDTGQVGAVVNTGGIKYQAAGGGCIYALGVPVTPDTTYTITIGAGGTGGDATYDGGNGAPGICIIEW